MSNRRRNHAAVVRCVAVTVLCCSLALAAQSSPQSQRLTEATRLLETKGDYLGAIAVLQEVAKGPDHAVAGRALLLLGEAYERLGRDGARQVYEQLLRDYRDQPQLTAEARARLARLTTAMQAAAAASPTMRQLWTQRFSVLGPLSPDGRWIPAFDSTAGALVLLNTATLQPTTVTPEPRVRSDGDQPSAAAVSPTGSRIAYGWGSSSSPNTWVGEIRVIGVNGAGQRTVLSENGADLSVIGWSPNGRDVFASRSYDDQTSDLLRVAVDTGAVTQLKHLPATPFGVSLSPDGRRIAYDAPQTPSTAKRDIVILDVGTSRERIVGQHLANDTYPVWHPDGHRLVFVSDRAGTPGLWLVTAADTAAPSEPSLIMADTGSIEPHSVSADGSIYMGHWVGLPDVYVSSLDRATNRWSAPATVARKVIGNNYFSAWSPDSRWIVLTSRRGGQRVFDRGTHTLVFHDMVTNDERELTPDVPGALAWPAWSPDGRSLMVVSNSQHGLYRVDTATGAVSTLVAVDPAAGMFTRSAWMPDGRHILFKYAAALSLRNLDTEEERVPYEAPTGSTTWNAVPSPDGHLLAAATRGKLTERFIQVGPVDGGPFRTVMTVPPPELLEVAGWTPDGLEVVVTRTTMVGGRQQGALWSVPVAGGAPRELGVAMARLRDARLSPDGQRVSFTAGDSVLENWVLDNALRARATARR